METNGARRSPSTPEYLDQYLLSGHPLGWRSFFAATAHMEPSLLHSPYSRPALKSFQFKLSPRTDDYLIVFVLLAAGLAIFGQTFGFPFISFDDPGYVYENPHVRQGLSWEAWRWAWTSFERSNWHPLTWLSLMLDARFYGLNAGGYHLTNLLLHLANTVLLFVWLRTATGARWPSALTAFFFVAHPLHVESVAWITERKDVLSTLFFFLTLLAYTRFTQGKGRTFYWLALALFAVGLTAKPMLVTLPPLLLLLDYWPLRRNAVRWGRLILEKTPFFVLGAASCVVTVFAQRGSAMVPLGALPPTHRLASAALGYGTYLQKTFWPVGLGVYYPYWHSESFWWPVAWGIALAAISAGVIVWRRSLPFVLVGWGWFLGTLVPVIGVVQVGGQAVADRYTYLPHVGLFIALFWTGAAAWRHRPATRVGLAGFAAVAAAACVLLSCRQAALWCNSLTLFEHTVRVTPPSTRLFHLLGDALLEADRPADAEAAYLQAWRISPANADVAPGLGALLIKDGKDALAIEVLERWRADPAASADILNDLALALAKNGRPEEAAAVYRRCQDLHPDFALAHFGLADLLRAHGNFAEATAEDQAGLVLRDDWLPALTRLAWSYAQSADPQARAAALALAKRAVDVSGGHDIASLNALAIASAASGFWSAAVDAAGAACDLAGRPGAPAGAVDICRDRLEFYRRGQIPPL